MHLILLTGSGGAGRSTLAAALATRCAGWGRRVGLMSFDPPWATRESFAGIAPGVRRLTSEDLCDPEPDVDRLLTRALVSLGVDPLGTTDLEHHGDVRALRILLAWHRLRVRGELEVLVVDGPSAVGALDLVSGLALWHQSLQRLLPMPRRIARALTPAAGEGPKWAGHDMGGDALVTAVSALQSELVGASALWNPGHTAVIPVCRGDVASIAEIRWLLMGLNLQGVRVPQVLVRSGLAARFGAWPEVLVPTAASALGTRRALSAFARSLWPRPEDLDAGGPAAAPGGDGPGAADPAGPVAPAKTTREGDRYVLTLAVPWAQADEVRLGRREDELVVTIAGVRRDFPLASVLRRCSVVDAQCRQGSLRVVFEPDPEQWPSGRLGEETP